MKFDPKFQIHKAAAEEATRYAVEGILIEGDKAIATDGRIMAVVPIETDGDSKGAVVSRAAWEMATKSARIVQRATKATPAVRSASMEVQERIARVIAKDLGSATEFPNLDGAFPDHRGVIPRGAVVMRIGINAELLLNLAKAIGAYGADGTEAVELVLRSDSVEDVEGCPTATGPIEVRAMNQEMLTESQRALGIIMPVGLDNKNRKRA